MGMVRGLEQFVPVLLCHACTRVVPVAAVLLLLDLVKRFVLVRVGAIALDVAELGVLFSENRSGGVA